MAGIDDMRRAWRRTLPIVAGEMCAVSNGPHASQWRSSGEPDQRRARIKQTAAHGSAYQCKYSIKKESDPK